MSISASAQTPSARRARSGVEVPPTPEGRAREMPRSDPGGNNESGPSSGGRTSRLIDSRSPKIYVALSIALTSEIRQSDLIHGFFPSLQPTSRRSECDSVDNLSICPNQDPESVSPPRRRNRLSVLIGVPILDGVSEKDVARNVAIDETDTKR